MSYCIEYQEQDGDDRAWHSTEERFQTKDDADNAVVALVRSGEPWSRRALHVVEKPEPTHPEIIDLIAHLDAAGVRSSFVRDGDDAEAVVFGPQVVVAVRGVGVREGLHQGRPLVAIVREIREQAARERAERESTRQEATAQPEGERVPRERAATEPATREQNVEPDRVAEEPAERTGVDRERAALARLLRCGPWATSMKSSELVADPPPEGLPPGARQALQELVGVDRPTARQLGNALKRVVGAPVEGTGRRLVRTKDRQRFAVWRVVDQVVESDQASTRPTNAARVRGALMSLGYSKRDADHAVSQLGAKVDTEAVGELIREALDALEGSGLRTPVTEPPARLTGRIPVGASPRWTPQNLRE